MFESAAISYDNAFTAPAVSPVSISYENAYAAPAAAVYSFPASTTGSTDWGNVFSGVASGLGSLGNAAANIIRATNQPTTPTPIFDSLTGIQVRPTAANPLTPRSNLVGAVSASASGAVSSVLSVLYSFMPVLVIGALLWVAVKFFGKKK